jgi:serine/threonine protein kinase/Flp pilus assembly protein TadD
MKPSDALPALDDPRVVQAMEEYLAAIETRCIPDRRTFLQRHADIAGTLGTCLDSLEFVQQAAAQLREPSAGFGGLAEAPGTPLGDFRILRELGRGGMGIVYEAEQQSLGRRVALKVLPLAGTLDSKRLQRFKHEAQAAACLHHPHIVPIYGVGCERGVHYYAMQFIEGQTLAHLIADCRGGMADWTNQPGSDSGPAGPVLDVAAETGAADRERARRSVLTPTLPTAARSTVASTTGLARFRTAAHLGMQAALALEHAHQLGIVHRDIKPANLLVDGHGHLWVTDFGLAHCQSQAGLTITGDLVGTLRYMSPEQALAQPGGVDQRTDLYALGATLYELLTLEPPFDSHDRQELLRQIDSEEPKPVRAVNKAVPAELETIVLKAMAKSPAERYATAQELADDLQRFLNDEPIRARRPTAVQRARRWARRHQPVIWSAAIALLAALAVLAGSVGWIARDRAARQARVANEIEAALREADGCRREGNLVQAEAAARRAEALLQHDADEPALVARVQGLLGELAEDEADGRLLTRLEALRLLQAEVNVKDDAFVLERALPDYRQAFLEYGWRVGGMAPREVAALLRRRPAAFGGTVFAAMDHWLILARHLKAPEATWLEQVLATADPDPWRQRVRLARARNDRRALEELAREVDATAQPAEELFLLDRSLRHRGADEGALALLRRAQEAFPGDFWINHDLGMALHDCQPPRDEEAIRFLTVAVALRPQSAGAHLNLGVAFLDHGRFDEAIGAFRKAITLQPDYAMAYNNLGLGLTRKGRFGDAVAAYRRAIELKPDFALAYNNLAAALEAEGRVEDAIAAYRQAIQLNPRWAGTHYNLGRMLQDAGHIDEALAAFRQAIDLNRDFPEAHFAVGDVLSWKGRREEAVTAYRRAIELRADYAEAHCNLGDALREQGKFAEALEAFKRGHERGSRRPNWPYPSAQWVRECQRLIEIEGRLPGILASQVQPASAAERNEYATLCFCKRHYVAAARLWADAFTADPKLAADPLAGHRYDAACATALAAVGQGGNDGPIAVNERVRWRKQALHWLRADLETNGKLLERGRPADRSLVSYRLRIWRCTQDLAGLRDSAALAQLPAEEQAAWKQLWADVEAVFARALAAR